MFGIGIPELILILVVALVIFGPSKLPEIGSSLGQGLRDSGEPSRVTMTPRAPRRSQRTNSRATRNRSPRAPSASRHDRGHTGGRALDDSIAELCAVSPRGSCVRSKLATVHRAEGALRLERTTAAEEHDVEMADRGNRGADDLLCYALVDHLILLGLSVWVKWSGTMARSSSLPTTRTAADSMPPACCGAGDRH